MTACGHPLCALIGGACSLAIHRSRGCRPNVTAPDLPSGVVDEVRDLVTRIEAGGDDGHAAAVRLAALVRREALDDRNLVSLVGDEAPELAPVLVRLCLRAATPRPSP